MNRVLITGASGFIGKPLRISNAKAKHLLGINIIPVEVTLRDSAEYLIKNGFVKK
jgi:dihydroflavonol-4-reductase